jgi:fatty acid desaturase
VSKVFISKKELEEAVLRKKNKMTPFLFIFVWFYAILCLVTLLPVVFIWCAFTLAVILAYLPFYFIDKVLFERKEYE